MCPYILISWAHMLDEYILVDTPLHSGNVVAEVCMQVLHIKFCEDTSVQEELPCLGCLT